MKDGSLVCTQRRTGESKTVARNPLQRSPQKRGHCNEVNPDENQCYFNFIVSGVLLKHRNTNFTLKEATFA